MCALKNLRKMAAASVASAGGMLEREEESEAEVRREDQDNINKFGRLNARLHELRDERNALKVRLGLDGWNRVRMSTFYCILILIYSFNHLEITGTNG